MIDFRSYKDLESIDDWKCFDLEHGCTDLRNISKYLNVLSSSKKKIN